MKHTNYIPILAMLSLSALAVAPVTAHAQRKAARVSIHLRDRPVRAALERIFNDAGLQHAIDPRVSGYVTLKIRNQPFENALKLIMRSSTIPLTYTKENNVYIVKPVQTAPVMSNTSGSTPDVEDPTGDVPPTYVDPTAIPQLNSSIYYANPFAYPQQFNMGRNIIMGSPGLGGFGMNNIGGLGAGGSNVILGGGFGGFNPYWGGFAPINLGGGIPIWWFPW